MNPTEKLHRQPSPSDTPKEDKPADGAEGVRATLSPKEVAERIQKVIQDILFETYRDNQTLWSHVTEYSERAIENEKQREKPDPSLQRILEWDRRKDLVQLWTAKARFWLVQDPRETTVRWKEFPPPIFAEKERAAIAQTAREELQEDKRLLEEELKKRVGTKFLTEEELQAICDRVRMDLLMGAVAQHVLPTEEPRWDREDILARFMHFSDVFHLNPTSEGVTKFTRIFKDGDVCKRVEFLRQNPLVLLQNHGGRQVFITHTLDEKDLKKVIRTEKLSVSFASAEREYCAKPDDPRWEDRRQLIRNILTTPTEDLGLFAVLNVTNFFHFHGTTKSDAETIADFPFAITKLYEDNVVNHRFFLERLFDLLWSKQEGGVTAEECTSIIDWVKNNHDLFTEGTPEDIEEFMEVDRALAEKAIQQNTEGIYRIPHATNLKGALLLKYSCKDPKGWLYRFEPKRNIGESERAFETRQSQPPRWSRVSMMRYIWGTGDVIVGNHKVILDHLVVRLQGMRWQRWEAHVIDFVQQLVLELDGEKAQELERGMRFFNELLHDGLNLHKDGSSTFRDLCRMFHLYSFQKEKGIWSFDRSVFQFKFDPREGWMWGVTDKNQINVSDILAYKDGVDRQDWYALRVSPSNIFVDRKQERKSYGPPLGSAVAVFDRHVAKMRSWSAPPKKAPTRKKIP